VVESFQDSSARLDDLTFDGYKRVDDRLSITFRVTELVYVTAELLGVISVSESGGRELTNPLVLLDGAPTPIDDLERRGRAISDQDREIVLQLAHGNGEVFFEAVAREVAVKRDLVEPLYGPAESIY
jgi:hypothetical protein